MNLAAHAVMSHHHPLVLRVDVDRAADWNDEEVLRRWAQIFARPRLVQRFLLPQAQGRTGNGGGGQDSCHPP